MATVKRTSGDYIITTVDPASNVEIQTRSLIVDGDFVTTGSVDFSGTGNITASSIDVTNDITANGNITAGGAISAVGNIIGAVFIGDGTGLTGIAAGNALGNIISFGTSRVAIPEISGNVFVNVAGVSNVAVFSSTGANITGNLRTGNILSGGFFFANGQPLTGSVKYDAQAVQPVLPNPGDFWFNTVNGVLYQYNADGTSDQWVDISGIGTPPSTTSAVANSVIQRDVNASATANVWQGTSVLVTGNITSSGGSINAAQAQISSSIQGGQALFSGNIISSGGWIQGTQALISGNITATSGNIIATGGFFIGDGSQLSNIGNGSAIAQGSTSVNIPTSGGQVLITVGGSPSIAFTSTGINNLFGNGIGNIGNSSGYFNTVFAKATSAQYADLAEVYDSDQDYAPGTVLIFGGDREVTQSTQSHDPRVAGVVSTEPAYLMNSAQQGVAVALVGKTPCRVIGPVTKGDLLVTASIPGTAQKMREWVPGAVMGKSLENLNDGEEAIIQIVAGRH
jgi:hypothetical protein